MEGTVYQTLGAWKKLDAKDVMAKAVREATEKHMQYAASSIK